MSQVSSRTIDVSLISLENKTIDISVQPTDLIVNIAKTHTPLYQTSIIIDQMIKGDKGDKGDPATITIGDVTKGDNASVINSGTKTDAIFNFVLPKGDKGDKGEKGDKGDTGPKGEQGDIGQTGQKGDKGDAATINVGNVTKGDDAQVTNSGTQSNAVFDFVLPKGDPGVDGITPIKGKDYFTAQDVGEIEAYVINELIGSITTSDKIWASTTQAAIDYMNEHHTWVEGVIYYTEEEDDTDTQEEI